MYEGLTDHQAKQLLFYHGQNGSFLFVQQEDMLTVYIQLGCVSRKWYRPSPRNVAAISLFHIDLP